MFYTYDDISRVKYFSSVLYNINNLYKNLYSDDENYVNKKEFDILNRFVRSFYNLILVVEDVVLLDDGSAVKKSDFGDFIASEFQKLDSKILNLNLEKENFQDSSFKFYSVFLDFSNNLINGLKDNKDSNNLRLTLISFKESISTNMNLTFRESISNLSSKNYNINFNRDNTLKSISDNDTLNESQKYLNLLKKEEQSYKERADTIIQNFQKEISQIQANYTESIKNTISELSFKIETANKDFKETYHDYEILKKMVNRSGEQQVTDHYSKRAFWERITYWVMTIITFIIIIISVCLALHGLNEYKAKTDISATMLIEKYKDESIEKIEKIYSVAQENALIYLVLRLIFSVLLFSSIIYTSRVAYRAYVHMRHSENMMLKLATLRPFINQLNETERNQIHKDLVPDYFGKDAGMVDSMNEKFKDIPSNVSAIAIKAIEQISSKKSIKNNDEEIKNKNQD